MMEKILLRLLFLSEWFILSTCLVRHYHFVDQSLTWTEAQTYCRQTYTDLATIENSEELNQFMNTLSYAGQFWIGLYNKINWRWSDGFNGTGADYRNWYSTEPDMSSSWQFCVMIIEDLGWVDHFCSTSYPFICYRGTQKNPEYVLVNESMSWSNAQSYCRENFVDLATVRNDAENQGIISLGLSDWTWIGLFRDPDFYWSDGSSFLFINEEDVASPINSLKVICGVASGKSGKWKFLPCETKLPFVCYSYPIMKQVVKLETERLEVEDSVDLKDPVVKADLLKQLQDRLEEDGVDGVTLKWREQPDGEVFHKEEKRKKSEL
ncbi:lymphocyte antigen 75-like [Cololabis saira]|uniref:lymphocyte antigen 75-like n=1 Tax=Cololabis saira TaxID=129043 RepID=UPI002AD2C926|nr:lymphocyte antigen 75-like [Cololabis saira]